MVREDPCPGPHEVLPSRPREVGGSCECVSEECVPVFSEPQVVSHRRPFVAPREVFDRDEGVRDVLLPGGVAIRGNHRGTHTVTLNRDDPFGSVEGVVDPVRPWFVYVHKLRGRVAGSFSTTWARYTSSGSDSNVGSDSGPLRLRFRDLTVPPVTGSLPVSYLSSCFSYAGPQPDPPTSQVLTTVVAKT